MKFIKMHGIGNDYVYINLFEEKFDLSDLKKVKKFVIAVSDRNFGIGSDGVIFIEKSKVADAKMKIFNKDGSEAKMCGNGIRCVAKILYDKKIVKKDKISIETLSGIKEIEMYANNGLIQEVKVDMGRVEFESKEQNIRESELKIDIENKQFLANYVSVGNPHLVIIVKDLENVDVEKYGCIIENKNIFKDGINIEFVEIIDKNNINVRVYERGSKETLACGTGACASVAVLYKKRMVEKNVNVHLKGGILKIEYDSKKNRIYMTGTATKVYEGVINEEEFFIN